MMKRTSNDKVEPALEGIVLHYKRTGKDKDGPSVDLFRPDFSESSTKKSPWNKRLAEIFVADYTKNGHPFSELKNMTDYFLTYIRSLQTTHRMMNTSSGRGTVHEENLRRTRILKRKKNVSYRMFFCTARLMRLITFQAVQAPIECLGLPWNRQIYQASV
jgi:hypothetical protein